MRYFSTFSGIGGFELGIQLAYDYRQKLQNGEDGIDNLQGLVPDTEVKLCESLSCIGFSEIDKYASQIYQRHFPTHHNYGDITKIVAEDLPDFDLLVGGFPCQAFSIAGKRGGFEDTRGTMFFELARILRAKQPRLFVFENVKGLLSHDGGKSFATIIQTLDELGYDCQWQVLNSKNHGVPQNRERVFIVGHLRGQPRPEVFPFGETAGATDEGLDQSNTEVASTLRSRYGNGTGSHIMKNPITQTEYRLSKGKLSRQPFVRVPEATKQGYAEATVGQSINLSVPNSKTRRGRVSDVAQTLDTGMQQHTLTKDAQIRRLTPTECERLQGFPDVEKRVILQVCTENLNNLAYVEDQSHKWQNLVGNVEKNNSQENVLSATESLLINNQQTSKPAQPDVLINCVENGVEIHSQGKLLLNAKGVAKKNWYPQFMELEDFVQIVAGINTTLGQITKHGEVESHLSEECLILQQNGKKLVRLCGKEMMQLAESVKNDSTTLKKLLKSITSDHSDIKSLEQKLITSFSFVILAINGYIPKGIQNQSICTIEIKSKLGWTEGVSDTQRYKTLGNAVTVNVIKDIFTRIGML